MEKTQLAQAYDLDAERRARSSPAQWKLLERERFLNVLLGENKRSLLEIGAGTGTDGKYYKDNGIDVTCIDLSGEMIRYCKERGLRAMVMDFYHLDFEEESFEAVYALNCLLHVPKSEINRVLAQIKRVMKPGGVFYMGLYGGKDSEGIWMQDWCEPKRFFASYADDSIKSTVSRHFEVAGFHTIPMPAGEHHFQSLLLIK